MVEALTSASVWAIATSTPRGRLPLEPTESHQLAGVRIDDEMARPVGVQPLAETLPRVFEGLRKGEVARDDPEPELSGKDVVPGDQRLDVCQGRRLEQNCQ